MDLTEEKERISESYACTNCGAALKYKPGTDTLICNYCGGVNKIKPSDSILIEELDFKSYMESLGKEDIAVEKVIECKNCGASSCVQGNIKSLFCPNCSSPLIESDIHEERLIRPAALLPFTIGDKEVYKILSKWVGDLWFAPNNLSKAALSPIGLQGVYIPYWTYDAQSVSDYSGERGVDYTVTVGSGENKREETRTRWSSVSGTLDSYFDDIMVPASGNISGATLYQLEPWDKEKLISISNEYLSGFITEKYMINLEQGFKNAKSIMGERIRIKIGYQIGGDRQRIHEVTSQYSDITFKHILVPIYTSSYLYNNKRYHFYVNGRNGKLIGDRPYSTTKIVLLVVFIFIVFALIAYFF
ncbi:hypothetical protein [Flavobacterium sp. '19STA2R22 D10 B1']|uniref:hypothetical protein n=1 Tax=Flavobacterium aerium TaxID=3037261 RepID=UPI00278C72C8|nr:hypothetical protein [Flavobacterium sp. '19STA2R22 D10 B1']